MRDKKMSKALYRGRLPIGGLELDCYVLDDDTRVLSATSIFEAFDRPSRGTREQDKLINLPNFMAAKNLLSYINQELRELINIIEFKDGEQDKKGYKAEILPALCSLYLDVRRDGKLVKSQLRLAKQSEILLSSFAKVGIIALVDEATGFQYDRKHEALRIILEKYITEGFQKWIKTFPDEFFVQLDRLYEKEKTSSRKRPMYYGKFINQYVYEPIESGYVKTELDKLNITDEGKRKARFHQWLTEFGKGQLSLQIGRVMGVMEMTTNINKFREKIKRQKELSIYPDFFPETLED
jgi:hypothetical protein